MEAMGVRGPSLSGFLVSRAVHAFFPGGSSLSGGFSADFSWRSTSGSFLPSIPFPGVCCVVAVVVVGGVVVVVFVT